MANPNWYQANLPDILWPQGNRAQGPLVIPDVLDSDGRAIFFTDPRRVVSQVTGVDVGDSPNSNTGDPLRTAFVKIDNIVEALYRNDLAKAFRLAQLERSGRFIGMHDYATLATTYNPPLASVTDPTVGPSAHFYPQEGDWCILRNLISAGTARFDSDYWLITRQSPSIIITAPGPVFTVNSYSVLQFTKTIKPLRKAANYNPLFSGTWMVVQQQTLDDFEFNIDAGLARLAVGDADWGPSANPLQVIADQKELYAAFVAQSVADAATKRLRSRNLEDAITELVARATVNAQDAGYYG